MPAALPKSAKHLVIGAGVHGLSTAWHLADAGEEVLVVDKDRVAAGASGIACGVIRNNYFQPAMQELMAACVEIWESDPQALHYHGSGYIALGPPAQEEELSEVFERQQRIGYDSELHTGEADVAAHMKGLFGDWRAPGLTRLPARARRWLRLQPGIDARPRRQGARGGGGDRRGRRGDGLRLRRVGRGDGRADLRRPDRGRAGRDRGRPLDRVAVGDARPAGPHRRQPSRRQRGQGQADVDLLVPAGGRGIAASEHAEHRRRRRVARAPRRLARAAGR